jgi:hypothetical protein
VAVWPGTLAGECTDAVCVRWAGAGKLVGRALHVPSTRFSLHCPCDRPLYPCNALPCRVMMDEPGGKGGGETGEGAADDVFLKKVETSMLSQVKLQGIEGIRKVGGWGAEGGWVGGWVGGGPRVCGWVGERGPRAASQRLCYWGSIRLMQAEQQLLNLACCCGRCHLLTPAGVPA